MTYRIGCGIINWFIIFTVLFNNIYVRKYQQILDLTGEMVLKLLVIDGNSIINRAFYGIKLLTTKDGQYTNGVYGFINILNRLRELEEPDCVAVAFDLKAPTFRHEMYSEYKAGRKGMPDELRSQMPILKDWLNKAGYSYIECPGFEADDILGTLSRVCEENGNECVISTGDRDSLQLVSDKTRVLLAATRMGKTEIINYDKAALFEKYGLTPDEMIELKALMGDSSDNIPGVAGVGEKTATDLITRYHSIDYIYDNLEVLEIKEGVRKKLSDGKESAFLSRKLGTICKTAPIDCNIEKYKIKPMDTWALSSLMTSLEFFKLMEKMGIEPSVGQTEMDLFSDTVPEIEYSNTLPEISGEITILVGENSAAAVNGKKVFELENEELITLLADHKTEKRLYDYKNLSKKYEINNVTFDGMLGAYLCNPSSSSYEVDRLIAEYGGSCPDLGEVSDTVKQAVLYSTACDNIIKELNRTEQLNLLREIEIPLAKVLGEMESYGFLVDKAGLDDLSIELGQKTESLEKEIHSLVGYEFNLNSPKQLGVALFEKLGLPAKKKTKSGYSTSAEVLEELRDAHPAVELLLEYRKLAKLKSTYADGLAVCIAKDGRIHSTFNQTEARTGRISSLEPNLQNIPVRTEEGKRLREYFIAPEGRVLCDADYSQIELRVLASIAQDKNMIDAFTSGVDIHTATASQVFSIPIDMVSGLLRSRAKAVNFGIVYGIGAFSLAKDIGVSRAEAASYIENYLATYKGVADYMENTIKAAKADGFVKTIFGRRRYLPELSNSNRMIASFGERVARNAPIQGTAADIIKLAMINVSRRLAKEIPSARLILQVHDELIVECDEKDANAVCSILSEEMENSAKLQVKLTADSNYGKNWLEAKG